MVPFHDHVLCKPRIILLHQHLIKFESISFYIIGGHIVNHEKDLGPNFMWRNLRGKGKSISHPMQVIYSLKKHKSINC